MSTNNTPLRLLMVEDVEDDVRLVVRALERGGYAVSHRRVDTEAALRAALEEQSWDLLTSDHAMPQFSAPAAVALAHALRPTLPIIILSNEISHNLAVELMRAGAHDYICKDALVTLPPIVARELAAAEAERRCAQAEAALRESEARWQFALEGADEGVWDWNVQAGKITFSRQWKAMLGYTEDEIGDTVDEWEALIHPDDSARVIAVSNEHVAGQTPIYLCEYRIQGKDGAYRWILDRGKIVSRTPEGKPLRVIGTQTDITERKQAEAELKRLKEFNEGIIQGMLEGIVVQDALGRYTFANPAACRILDRTPETLLGQPWQIVIPPDQQSLVNTARQRRIADSRDQYEYEIEVMHPDGQRVPVLASSTPRFENGQYAGVLTVFADLTERNWAIRQLQASEAKFRSVVENAPWGMHFFQLAADGSLILTGANPAADAILGTPHAGLIGQTLEQAFPHFTGTEISRHYREAAERGTAWHTEQIGYVNGQVTSAFAIHAFQTAPSQMVAVVENIIERKRAEEIIQTQAEILHGQNQELRLQNRELIAQGQTLHQTEMELRINEEKFRTLIETTDTGYVILDAAGRVRDANGEYLRLTGRLNLAEILGHPVTDWTAPHDQARNGREVQACVEEGFVRNLEIDYINPEGRLIPVEINATVLPTAEGSIIVTLCRDITERKQAQAGLEDLNARLKAEIIERKSAEVQTRHLNLDLERRVAERTSQLEAANRELEAFTYSISHDLQAPLRVIDGFAAILQQEYTAELPKDALTCLHGVTKNTRKMGQLIDDLLSFSRLSRQPLNKCRVEPARLAQEALDDLHAEQAGRHVEIALGRLPDCQADPALLKQVFANLLSNALKYTRRREVAQIEIGALRQAGQDVYYIKDNGAGFDMQNADQLFGVFQRLHGEAEFEGTGIGLANVQRIIHRHGGQVWAEAEVERGAAFYFTLPDG